MKTIVMTTARPENASTPKQIADSIQSALGVDSLEIDAIYSSPYKEDHDMARALQAIFNAESGKDLAVMVNPQLRVIDKENNDLDKARYIFEGIDPSHTCVLVVTKATDIYDLKRAFGEVALPSTSETTLFQVEKTPTWSSKKPKASVKELKV